MTRVRGNLRPRNFGCLAASLISQKEGDVNTQEEWWKDFFHGIAVDLWLAATTEEQTRREADFIQALIGARPNARLLDVPCGGGRHAIELASRGYRLAGVDFAEDFLREARSKSAERRLAITWEHRDMRHLPWNDHFDGAYCFGNSFGYFDDVGNEKFLNAIGRALKPGAKFILEASVAETVLPSFQERRWFQFGQIIFLIESRFDHIRGRINSEYSFIKEGKIEKKAGWHRIYSYRELCLLLEEAGLIATEGYGSLTQEPFKLGSQRLFLVATKKA